jgi:hypothetical protein
VLEPHERPNPNADWLGKAQERPKPNANRLLQPRERAPASLPRAYLRRELYVGDSGHAATLPEIEMARSETLRTCPKGHKFRKTSDCPTCPDCESAKKSRSGYLATLSAPAQRALKGAGLTTLEKLSARTEKEVLALHGMGPASLPALRAALKAAGLSFRTGATPARAPKAKKAWTSSGTSPARKSTKMYNIDAADPKQYRAAVAAFGDWRSAVVASLREAVVAAAPLEEVLKWGHLVYLSNGPVLLIRTEETRVLFGFWRGQRLRHIEPRLKPGGKYELATLDLREGDEIPSAATVKNLVCEAVALNER